MCFQSQIILFVLIQWIVPYRNNSLLKTQNGCQEIHFRKKNSEWINKIKEKQIEERIWPKREEMTQINKINVPIWGELWKINWNMKINLIKQAF